MNSIFSFKRFLRFAKYDINRNFSQNFKTLCLCVGVGMLILLGRSLLHSGNEIILSKTFCFLTSVLVLVFVFPEKSYGFFTDKIKGPQWVLIPASPLEKLVTVVLNMCIIVPAVTFALLVGCDFLFHLFLPEKYGPMFFSGVEFKQYVLDLVQVKLTVFNVFNILSTYILTSLAFTFGAMFFTKRKVIGAMVISYLPGKLFSFIADSIATTDSIVIANGSSLDSAIHAQMIFNIVLAVLLVVGIYHLIRNKQYANTADK